MKAATAWYTIWKGFYQNEKIFIFVKLLDVKQQHQGNMGIWYNNINAVVITGLLSNRIYFSKYVNFNFTSLARFINPKITKVYNKYSRHIQTANNFLEINLKIVRAKIYVQWRIYRITDIEWPQRLVEKYKANFLYSDAWR